MYTLNNGTRVVQPQDELPDLRNAQRLYLDFETTSGDTTRTSLNPWRKNFCKVLGISITVDDAAGAWYVPIRHWLHPDNLDKLDDAEWTATAKCLRGLDKWDWRRFQLLQNYNHEVAGRWLRDVLATAATWVNHNVKYDAHVAYNDDAIGFDVLSTPMRLVDTVTRAKIVDSDMGYHGGYSLDNLSKRWLNCDIDALQIPIKANLAERYKVFNPETGKYSYRANRDYGLCSIDGMAKYAGGDVLSNRHLDYYLMRAMPSESREVCETETRLTKILVDMERTGLHVNLNEIRAAALIANGRCLALQSAIANATGFSEFKPHVNNDCYQLLIVHYGLPVLAYTEDIDPEELHLLEPGESPGNPSFSKSTLKQYLDLHEVRENKQLYDVISKILLFRYNSTKLSIFLNPYKEILEETGESVIHSSYNQVVRTGRMSCKEPNNMQLDKDTKALIHPAPGCGLISSDASQIEFRTIVHYINDRRCIETYNREPDTDFHQWVADMAEMSRKPAKTVNFMAGYGGGKKKTVKLLSASVEVAEKIRQELGDISTEEFNRELERRALKLYEKYHDSLPTLKPRSKEAERVCRNRGYVSNWYGRRRYLPSSHAHIAFNTVNQSTAADIVKERMVDLYERIKAAMLPVNFLAQVHDNVVLQAPAELATDQDLHRDIVRVLEQPARPLSVPIRWSIGYSLTDWRDADKERKDGGNNGTLPDVHTTQPVYF